MERQPGPRLRSALVLRPAWRWAAVWLLCALIATAPRAGAQATAPADGTGVGRSLVLGGPWLAAAGDNPQFAATDLDDSGWVPLRQSAPLPPSLGRPASIWFRKQVRLSPRTPPVSVYVEGLYLNYSVYVNGVRIGQQGDMRADHPTQLHPPEGFLIPASVMEHAGQKLVIALHVAGGPVGFLGYSPMGTDTRVELVGPDEVPVRQSYHLAHHWGERFALLAFNVLVGLCGLVIWWSLREQREYLALAMWLLCNALTVTLNFKAHLAGVEPASAFALLLVFTESVSTVAELEFVRLLLKRKQDAFWLTLEFIAFSVNFFQPLLDTGFLPVRAAATLVFVRPLITEVFVCVTLLRGTLRGNRDAPLLLLPFALWSLSDVYGIVQQIVLFGLGVQWPDLPSFHSFSYTVDFDAVASTFGLFSLILIILRRTIRLSRERADLAAEVAAAEELQLLLMARASRPTPGYLVQTEYRPMQQVGGDFFLVQPCEEDNSLVAIVGDVSGKGLQAAMRVSMILGVLQREVMGHPERVLQKLNTALLAQGDLGFTTACCVRIEEDGSFCFANAGHLNPYLEGEELESDGSLPLGIDPKASYPLWNGRLLPGQRLVLLSDGVVEARSKKGELFGFERTRKLVSMEAAAMADVAQRFGQEDDITVLSLALV